MGKLLFIRLSTWVCHKILPVAMHSKTIFCRSMQSRLLALHSKHKHSRAKEHDSSFQNWKCTQVHLLFQNSNQQNNGIFRYHLWIYLCVCYTHMCLPGFCVCEKILGNNHPKQLWEVMNFLENSLFFFVLGTIWSASNRKGNHFRGILRPLWIVLWALEYGGSVLIYWTWGVNIMLFGSKFQVVVSHVFVCQPFIYPYLHLHMTNTWHVSNILNITKASYVDAKCTQDTNNEKCLVQATD